MLLPPASYSFLLNPYHFSGWQASTQSSSLVFVCVGLTSLLNIWGHIATEPACSSGTLTLVLPHRNAMPQTQDMTPLPVTVYRHRADLSLCYPLMWNVTLEYTATHFNVRRDREILLRPSTHISECSTLWCCYGASRPDGVGLRSVFQGILNLEEDLLETTLQQSYMGERIPSVYLSLEKEIIRYVTGILIGRYGMKQAIW